MGLITVVESQNCLHDVILKGVVPVMMLSDLSCREFVVEYKVLLRLDDSGVV